MLRQLTCRRNDKESCYVSTVWDKVSSDNTCSRQLAVAQRNQTELKTIGWRAAQPATRTRMRRAQQHGFVQRGVENQPYGNLEFLCMISDFLMKLINAIF